PTYRSLGVSWSVKGDASRNAKVTVEYRKPGAAAWKNGPPLFRVEKGFPKDLPEGGLFAGSLVLLEPNSAYEIRLRLTDPDGGSAEKTLKAATIGEPAAAPGAPVRHVVPGNGARGGTAADPCKGLAA